jgi:KDO2-lipid IV(A) lauroyltransferase
VRVTESPARDLLRLVVWYPLRLVIERLPPRAGFWALGLLGRLHAALAAVRGGRKARIAAAVAAVAPDLPEAGRKAQVVEFFRTHYVNQLSIFVYPNLTRDNLGHILAIEGLSHLDAALAAGRGVVLPIGHFGPSQLPLAGLGVLGYPMVQIGFQNDEGLSFIGKNVAFRLRRLYEGRIPAAIVPPGPGARRAMAHLRGGGLVMTTMDDGPGQPPFGHHAPFPFPGGPLCTPLGPARLALASGAALCPAFLTPGERTPFRLRIDPPLPLPETPDTPGPADKNAVALALTRDCLARYAAVVAQSPGWWHGLEAHVFP